MSIWAVVFAVFIGVAAVAVWLALRLGRERDRATREAIGALRAQFAALASDELAEKSRTLAAQSREEVASVAGGLRDELLRSMEELRRSADAAARANAEIGAAMQAQVRGVRDSAELLGRKAEGLERALAGGGKLQGVWGEAVLAHVLERSGLREGMDYRLQKGEAGVGIPDAEVADPSGRVLVIDSKTSLTAFLRACNEGDPDRRKALLAEHAASVRKHVSELSEKDYIGKLRRSHPEKTYIREVAMFVPSEAAHAAALSADPALGEYANERGVAIVTPLTLLPYLRIVSLAWQQESVDRNHAEIIERARLLLQRADACLAALDDLGRALEEAGRRFEKVRGLVGCRDGAMSFAKPAQDLVALGVKIDKAKSRCLQGPST